MSRTYEIRLTSPGFDSAVRNLGGLGRESTRVGGLLSKLADSEGGLSKLHRRLNGIASTLERLQGSGPDLTPSFKSAENLTAAIERMDERFGAIGKTDLDPVIAKVDQLATGLERVDAAAKSIAKTPSGRAKATREASSADSAKEEPKQRGAVTKFIAGPNQRLVRIAEQKPLAIAEGNEAARKDLDRAEWLAKRSIFLQSQRNADPTAMERPGLLELFSDLNHFLRDASRGNVLGAVQQARQLGFHLNKGNEPGGSGPVGRALGFPMGDRSRGATVGNISTAGSAIANQAQRTVGANLTGRTPPRISMPSNEPPALAASSGNSPAMVLARKATPQIAAAATTSPALSEFVLPGAATAAGAEAGTAASGMIAAAMNPVTLAVVGGITATIGGLYLLKSAAGEASRNLRMIGSNAAAAGASPGEIAGLRAYGVSPDQAPGLGASLRQRLSSDPFAMSVGGYALPGQLTGESDAPLIRRQLERLRGLYEEGRLLEMVRQTRILGLEGYRDELMVSRSVWAARKEDARIAEGIYNPQRTQEARDYKAAVDRLNHAFDNSKTVLGGPLIKMLSDGANAGATTLNYLNDIARKYQGVIGGVTDVMIRSLGPWGQFFAIMAQAGSKMFPTDPAKNSAQDANTKAIEELTKAIITHIGGGKRAAGALSPGERAAVQQGADFDLARRMGAYRI